MKWLFLPPINQENGPFRKLNGFEINEEFENNQFVFGPIAQLVRASRPKSGGSQEDVV